MAESSQPSVALSARRFFIALVLGAIAILAAMFRHLGPALIGAVVLAVLLWPLQTRLQKKLKKRRALAASVLVFGVVTLLVTPIVAMSAFAVREVTDGLKYVTTTVESEGMTGLVDRLPAKPLRKAGRAIISAVPKEQVGAQGAPAAAAVGNAVVGTASALFQLGLMVIALFFFLYRGEECLQWLDYASPLKRGQTRELLADVKKVSFSVIISTFLTAGVQSVAAFIGYLIARVPHALFFGGVTFVFALIPAVGATAVCVVAGVLLIAAGQTGFGIFLVVWGIVLVGVVENLLKPYLIKGRAELNGAVVFFSLIGGVAAFGSVGLLVGPISVSLFLALLKMYHRDFSGKGALPAS